ncbi:PAS domain-containing protein [Methylotuvimicrobium sp. KM2]|uniref:PAS domain-containing protein n=1 Tax=Methylotuvimicrobium sp. KM2 TaxID=3133976 RepID=UPI0031016B64
MSAEQLSRKEWAHEVETLRARLDEAEETLHAIRSGEVDALVVAGPQGDQVFTLNSADHSYRVFIEEMKEGAVTLSEEGLILHCNQGFAEIIKTPQDQLIGAVFASFVESTDLPTFKTLLQDCWNGSVVGEINGRAADTSVTLRLSLTRLPTGAAGDICVVVLDMTEAKQKEAALLRAHATLIQTLQELEVSRMAALNMMEDAVEAKKAVEVANLELQQHIAQRQRNEAENQRQLAELQQWYEVMLDREDRIIELKREADALRQRLGEPPRYAVELGAEVQPSDGARP